MKRVRRVAAAALALAIAGGACGGGEPVFTQDDLPQIVLQASEAPAGTRLDDAASGFRTVAEFAEDDLEERRFQGAGMQRAYYAWFFSPELFDDQGKLSPEGSLAFSFALLFDDADGAGEGLRLLEEDVRADGRDISPRPTDGLPPDSFGLYGVLDPRRPPGYMFAWRLGNTVFGLVAGGAPGAIREDAARALVDRMLARSA